MNHLGNIRDYAGSYPIQAVAEFYGLTLDTAFNVAGGILDRLKGRKQSVWYPRAMDRLGRETDHPNSAYADLQFFVHCHWAKSQFQPQ